MPTGPGDTEKQLGMMQDMRTTVLAATSSCALPPAERIGAEGVKTTSA